MSRMELLHDPASLERGDAFLAQMCEVQRETRAFDHEAGEIKGYFKERAVELVKAEVALGVTPDTLDAYDPGRLADLGRGMLLARFEQDTRKARLQSRSEEIDDLYEDLDAASAKYQGNPVAVEVLNPVDKAITGSSVFRRTNPRRANGFLHGSLGNKLYIHRNRHLPAYVTNSTFKLYAIGPSGRPLVRLAIGE